MPMHSSHQDSELVTGESGLKAFRHDDSTEQALVGCENKNIVFQFGVFAGGYDWSLWLDQELWKAAGLQRH